MAKPPQQRYSQEQVDAALRDLADGATLRDVSAKYGIPLPTIHWWQKDIFRQAIKAKESAQQIPSPTSDCRTTSDNLSIAKPNGTQTDWKRELREAAHTALSRALTTLPEASVAEATKAFSVFYDRLVLAEGGVTSRSEVIERHSVAVDALVERIGAAFAELSRGRDADPGDGEPIITVELSEPEPQ